MKTSKRPSGRGRAGRPVSRKSTKRRPLLGEKFASLSGPLKAAVFVLLFAAVGSLLLYFVAARPSKPAGDNEALFYYSEGHAHELFEADFEQIDYPVILYADGLLVCGEHAHEGEAVLTPTVRQAKLSKNQVSDFLKEVRERGFERLKEDNYQSDQELADPIAARTNLYVNFGRKQQAASYSSGEKPAEFEAVENFAKQYCRDIAKEEYAAERYRVDSVPSDERASGASDQRRRGLQRATAAVSARLDKNHRLADVIRKLEDVEKLQSQEVDKNTADEIVRQMKGKRLGRIELGGESVDVRVAPLIREYVLTGAQSEEITKADKGKVYAGAARTVEFVWFYASNQSLRSGASNTLNDSSNAVRQWYKSKVNKDVIHGGNRVYKGTKTLAQYETCPSGKSCSGDKLLAAFYSTQAEMKTKDAQVVILFQGSESSCKGWGSGNGMSGSNNKVVSSSQGYAIVNMTGCTWADGWQRLSAHELGHGFGSSHWCHNYNVMADSACSTTASSLSRALLHSTQKSQWRSNSTFFKTSASFVRLGEFLYGDAIVRSPQGKYNLVMQQSDGNLVVYESATGKAIWNSRTSGFPGSMLVFHTDGNFLVFKTNGTVCSSRTAGKGGFRLNMQDDGNLVIYKSDLKTAIWSSKGSAWYC